MDFAEYIQRYTDVNQMTRGVHLLQTGPGERLLQPSRLLLEHARQEDRVVFYKDLSAAVLGHFSAMSVPSLASEEELANWEIRHRETIDNKEYKINQAKNAGLKDSYRVSILDLGDYYYRSGDMANAMKLYMRSKDITITPEQRLDLYSRMAVTSLHKKNVSFAQNNAQKVLALHCATDRQKNTCEAIMGIAALETGLYRQAAECFLKVGSAIIRKSPVIQISQGKFRCAHSRPWRGAL